MEGRQHGNFTGKLDTYAFGIILWELLHFAAPWKEFKYPTQVMERVVKGIRPRVVPSREISAPDGYCSLMRLCWHQNPSHRPDFTVIAQKLREMIKCCPKQQQTLLKPMLNEDEILPLRTPPESTKQDAENFDEVRRGDSVVDYHHTLNFPIFFKRTDTTTSSYTTSRTCIVY